MTAPDMETIDRVDGQRLAGVSGYISEAHQGLIANGAEVSCLWPLGKESKHAIKRW